MREKKENKFLKELKLNDLTYDKKNSHVDNIIYYRFNNSTVSDGNYVLISHDCYDDKLYIVEVVNAFAIQRKFCCFKDNLESIINYTLKQMKNFDNEEPTFVISKYIDFCLKEIEKYENAYKKVDEENYKLRKDLEMVKEGLTFRIQKYCDFGYADFSDPTTNYKKYASEEYFKHFVDDSKKKFVDELIKRNMIKETESEDYLEWHINALPTKD